MSTSAHQAGQSRHANPVVAFVIGLSIVLLASILNAAGLNLTKLDHVRTSVIPKAARKKDWMRPLWLLGMVLYILSQLIGSTLALGYMRAEYVAPLGSTSLVFNFLFARFLVGTPVTNTDIYGTIVVIFGVVGIVAFGSINSGLTNEMDVVHLTYLWRRWGWLGYFFAMAAVLLVLLLLISRLDFILTTRGDISAPSLQRSNGPVSGLPQPITSLSMGQRGKYFLNRMQDLFGYIKTTWERLVVFVTQHLETWAAPKDDKYIAWTLGIGWACCGGGLAGGCLVFAKATIKLFSGSVSHETKGNQFGHFTPIVTIILLAITGVLQIVCLNRGLKIYDSTLVVPVFYGVYTATGWLDSLIFNDEVEAYKSWTLFLIFVSILVLIAGVVLLTHKKPEPIKSRNAPQRSRRRQKSRNHLVVNSGEEGHGPREEDDLPDSEEQVLWALGEDSDEEEEGDDEDEDADHHQNPINHRDELATMRTVIPRSASGREIGEHTGLVESDLEFADERDRWRGARTNELSRAGSSRSDFRPQR